MKTNKIITNKTRRNKIITNKTRTNKTRTNKTRRNKTRRNKTRTNKTRTNKTRRNKTRTNKTRTNKKYITDLNIYNTKFEDKVINILKKKNIDFESIDFDLEKEIVNSFKKIKNYNIKPNNDYYSYINNEWIKNINVEKNKNYIVKLDDFRIVQDNVYRQLMKIIEKYINDPNNKTKQKTIEIKNAYESFKKFNTIEQTRNSTKKIVDYIDELFKNKSNLWIILSEINKNEMISYCAPFVWTLQNDQKNPKIYKCYLEPPTLSLIDYDIYYDNISDSEKIKKYKKIYKKNYFLYLINLFNIAFGKNEYNVSDIWDCEIEILNAMNCNLIKNNSSYNLITKKECIEKFGFNWQDFCKYLGFTYIPENFITSNTNYLLCGTKLLLEKWNTPKWRTYWIYLFINQQCRWDIKGHINYFKFYGNFVRGQKFYIDKYILPIFGMSFTFNSFLTNEYISMYNDEIKNNYIKNMSEDLKAIFIRVIKRNSWLDPKTIQKAIKKIKKINIIIGSSKISKEDPLLNYDPNDPWGNFKKMSHWRHNMFIQLNNKSVIDIPFINWKNYPAKIVGNQAYVVNAYYSLIKNNIYIPLGYIQTPFINLLNSVEYNLSYIGFTIAHELSHSLDDLGNNYDENGVLNLWWTKKDYINFDKIKKNIIKQYEAFAAYDNINFHAQNTIGENIADIFGLFICEEYLRDFQIKNNSVLQLSFLQFQIFYTLFAVQHKEIINKKSITSQFHLNPHPLDKYRCNIPLSRSNIFRSIYNVKKGDKMWWHDDSSIWAY